MQQLIDKAILFVLCLTSLFLEPITTDLLLALLVALSVSALCSYFEAPYTYILAGTYVAGAVIFPQAAIFLPVIVYDCYGKQPWLLRYSWLLPLLINISRQPALAAAQCIIYAILAVLLQTRAQALDTIREKYYQMADTTREAALRLEKKNNELMEKQDYEVSLATLSERNRIAREIHDNVGHLLTRSILQLGALQVIHRQEPEISGQLDQLKETLNVAMDNIRSSVHDLHDESMDLNIQVCGLIEKFQFCPVKLNFDAGKLPREIQYGFIAIIKEALSNIARHSNATRASITILEHPGLYQLVIEDNGNVSAPRHRREETPPNPKASGGIGLQNMKDRVEALGGVFRIDQSAGFKIFISIPKER